MNKLEAKGYYMRRLLLSLLPILVSIPVVAQEPVVFQMPKDEDVYLRSYFFTGSEYFRLGRNGAYTQVNREHMGVDERDHGTWSQDDSGEVTLVSNDRYRDIECPPLSVSVWDAETIERLPWVKTRIEKVLTESDDQSFSRRRIEGIEKYGYRNWVSRVNVDFGVKRVSRENLEKLAVRIEQFLNDPQSNHFHATPMTYKGQTFLLWKDAQTSVNRDLARIKGTIDRQKPGSPPAYIYTRITAETFQKESRKTQEFIFFPQMNKCIPQPDATDK